MKELFSALSTSVFYPLVALVLPGLTAISAWLVYFTGFVGQRYPLVRKARAVQDVQWLENPDHKRDSRKLVLV